MLQTKIFLYVEGAVSTVGDVANPRVAHRTTVHRRGRRTRMIYCSTSAAQNPILPKKGLFAHYIGTIKSFVRKNSSRRKLFREL